METFRIIIIIILIIIILILGSYLLYLEIQYPSFALYNTTYVPPTIREIPIQPPPAPPCDPDDTQTCGPTSQRTCGYDGKWGPCQIIYCAPGYALDHSTKKCVRISCEANQITDCIPTSRGSKSGHGACNVTGTAVESCQIDTCNFCYTLSKDRSVCLPKRQCYRGKQIPCDVLTLPANANIGVQKCLSDCLGYDPKCTILQCNPGYTLANNMCLANECTNGQNRMCDKLPENSASGTQTCTNNIWGPCQITSCKSCYKLEDNKCVKSDPCAGKASISCTPLDPNALSGFRNCVPCVGPIKQCAVSACKPGYKINANSTACEKIAVAPAPPPLVPIIPIPPAITKATPMSVPIVKVTTY